MSGGGLFVPTSSVSIRSPGTTTIYGFRPTTIWKNEGVEAFGKAKFNYHLPYPAARVRAAVVRAEGGTCRGEGECHLRRPGPSALHIIITGTGSTSSITCEYRNAEFDDGW